MLHGLYRHTYIHTQEGSPDVHACSHTPGHAVTLVLDCTGFPGTVVEADDIKAANLDLTGTNGTCQHTDSDQLCRPMYLSLEAIPDCLGKKSKCHLQSLEPKLDCPAPLKYNSNYNYLVARNFHCKVIQDLNIINICNASTPPVNGSRIQSPKYPGVYHKTGQTCDQTVNPGGDNAGFFEFHFILKDFHIEESNECDEHSTEYVKFSSTKHFKIELWNLPDKVPHENYLHNEEVYLCNEAGVEMVIIYGYDAVIEFKIADRGPSLRGFDIELIVFNATEPTRGPSTTTIETTYPEDIVTTVGTNVDWGKGSGMPRDIVLIVVIAGVTFLVILVIIIVILTLRNKRRNFERKISSASSETSDRLFEETGDC